MHKKTSCLFINPQMVNSNGLHFLTKIIKLENRSSQSEKSVKSEVRIFTEGPLRNYYAFHFLLSAFRNVLFTFRNLYFASHFFPFAFYFPPSAYHFLPFIFHFFFSALRIPPFAFYIPHVEYGK